MRQLRSLCLHLLAGLIVFAAAATGAPTPASAQEATSGESEQQSGDSPSQDDMEKARQQFIDGRTDYQNGNFSEAADHFMKAYELSDRTELLYNIGKAYREAGRLVDAEHYFRKYLRRMPEAQNASEVGDYLVDINRQLAEQMASLQINSATSGRLVFINDDDSPRCLTPCDLTLEPGDYDVELRADGFKPASTSVSLKKGQSSRVSLELNAEPATGALAISTGTSGGMLSIEGAGEHGLPLEQPVELEAGSHKLTVTGPDGGTWRHTVDISAGERTTLFVPRASLQPDSGGASSGGSAKQLAGIGLLGASAALIASGAILGSQARQTHDALSSQQQTRGAVDPDLVKRGRAQMNAANILLGAGAGALLSGSGLVTWDLLSK